MVESKVYCTIIAANHQSQAVHCGKCLQGGVHLLKLVKQLRLIGQCGRRFKHVNLHKWTFRVSDWFYVWWDSEIWIKIVKHFWHPDVSTNTMYHQLNAVQCGKYLYRRGSSFAQTCQLSNWPAAAQLMQRIFARCFLRSVTYEVPLPTSMSVPPSVCPVRIAHMKTDLNQLHSFANHQIGACPLGGGPQTIFCRWLCRILAQVWVALISVWVAPCLDPNM